ncbi:4149_t:CDS:2 [Ambispora leptoticha]|uniref:4149_t:CDS:1 n=1 Tax=Ambispora leptoticha TaxID=144679 RepID=A0A9N9BLV7_9GLOM|nr:4149_t:CDS:2 [Ambispora leptoticha]
MTYLLWLSPLSKKSENRLILNGWPSLNYTNAKLPATEKGKSKNAPPESNITERLAVAKLSMNVSAIDTFTCSRLISYPLNTPTKIDIKRVSHLKVHGKPIRSAEGVVLYLIKYLAKSFQMRANSELAEKVGLLPGMGIYKFFRVIYGYDGERVYIAQKRKKPFISSQVFINNDYGFTEEVEKEFSDYFEGDQKDLRLKKQARQILKAQEPRPTNNGKITDLLKLCLRYSSGSQFEFKGKRAYADYQNHILPALAKINLPTFTKFPDYQVQDQDYIKFAKAAKLPWNKAINEYEPLEEIGESADSPE